MGEVRLTGRLVCADEHEAEVVREHLPAHLAATRAEPGCVFFEVTADEDDPLVWRVAELFRDTEAFEAHQHRVRGSAWGRATAGIERQYELTGA